MDRSDPGPPDSGKHAISGLEGAVSRQAFDTNEVSIPAGSGRYGALRIYVQLAAAKVTIFLGFFMFLQDGAKTQKTTTVSRKSLLFPVSGGPKSDPKSI